MIPSYDYSGEEGDMPPRLQGEETAYPVPDLDIAKNGHRRWVEVKTKASADWTRITRQFEHGIPRRHYEAYQRVAEITGGPVHLCVYEENTQDVLVAPLTALKVRFSMMGRCGMAYFGRDDLCFLFNLADPSVTERRRLVPVRLPDGRIVARVVCPIVAVEEDAK